MAKVSYVSPPSGLEDAYKKVLQPGDRFQFSRVRIRDIFLSRARVKGITLKSVLLSLASVWAGFSAPTKSAWESAGLVSNLTAWKMFVYDTAARKRASISGYATPNDIYQALVGKIHVESPATQFTIEQAHPLTYYIYKKVPATRSQYSPLQITEYFALPLTISLSYKTDLTSLGGDTRARFYAIVYSSYQGKTIETPLEISFGMSDDWQTAEATLTQVKGLVRGYSVFFEIFNARGDIYFDNINIHHNGENWARDPQCNNIAQSFTKAFFQVARHWVAVDPTDGTDFGSIYFN